MKRKNVAYAATAGAAVGVLGLTLLTLPAGAGADPALPEVAPEQLVESMMRASPPALTGTVEVENGLGLPPFPGGGPAAEMLADGTGEFQLWADGQGRHRAAVPADNRELTVVNDGAAVWKWDSGEQKVIRSAGHAPAGHAPGGHGAPADPATAARAVIGKIRQTSDVKVDGTASVAGRDAYELVLTPKPTERTLLREMRVAVDAEKRIPLEFSVFTNGSGAPAFRAGFSSIDMTAPDPALFRFAPPPGTKVEDGPAHAPQPRPEDGHRVVGEGWDAVLVTRLPQQQPNGQDLEQLAAQTGTPVSGPWGNGWVVDTSAGNALLTSDGRVAVGAVPEQVLTAALGEA